MHFNILISQLQPSLFALQLDVDTLLIFYLRAFNILLHRGPSVHYVNILLSLTTASKITAINFGNDNFINRRFNLTTFINMYEFYLIPLFIS